MWLCVRCNPAVQHIYWQVREVFAGLTALAGLGLVVAMCGVYYSIETIPAWHTLATWFFFFGSTLLTGPLAVGISLLVTWQIQMRTMPSLPGSCECCFFVQRVRQKRAPQRLSGSRQPRRSSTQEATAGTGVHRTPHTRGVGSDSLRVAGYLPGECTIWDGPPGRVSHPHHQSRQRNEAAQEVAHRMMEGHYLLIRLVLLVAAVILAGIFAFIRARDAVVTPSRALATIIVLAFALAVISELLGRGLHHEGLWHVGLNTPQTLLGH